jgi:hypothetical protein
MDGCVLADQQSIQDTPKNFGVVQRALFPLHAIRKHLEREFLFQTTYGFLAPRLLVPGDAGQQQTVVLDHPPVGHAVERGVGFQKIGGVLVDAADDPLGKGFRQGRACQTEQLERPEPMLHPDACLQASPAGLLPCFGVWLGGEEVVPQHHAGFPV